jgi:hypothetical protein
MSRKIEGRASFITSTAISKAENGVYFYDEGVMLVPHEAIRRDLLRIEHFSSKMNVLTYPWKILNLRTWWDDYFFKVIHAHQIHIHTYLHI